MKASQLDRDHHQGQKWDLLGEIEALKKRVEELERNAVRGLFKIGSITLQSPGPVLAWSDVEPYDGRVYFRSHGNFGGFIVWECQGVDGTARIVVADGDEDVTKRLRYSYVIAEVTGAGVGDGSGGLAVGGNVVIYTDGADICQLAVAANGMVTVQRTAGTDTFNVLLILIWQ